MVYVSRDASGSVTGIFLERQNENSESLPSNHPDILNFLDGKGAEKLEYKALKDLSQSDSNFVRVIEDVVDLLIAKNILTFTDLPEKVREKILSRRDARGRLAGSNDLVVPDDGIL